MTERILLILDLDETLVHARESALDRLGWSLKRVLIIDDEPIKLRRNYGNAIYVRPFEGAKEDNELELLATYLNILSKHDDMRSIEKRNWREKARYSGG